MNLSMLGAKSASDSARVTLQPELVQGLPPKQKQGTPPWQQLLPCAESTSAIVLQTLSWEIAPFHATGQSLNAERLLQQRERPVGVPLRSKNRCAGTSANICEISVKRQRYNRFRRYSGKTESSSQLVCGGFCFVLRSPDLLLWVPLL